MKWNKISEKKPEDDQNVLVWNDKMEGSLLHRAYYEEVIDCFFSLESYHSFPLKATHWSKMDDAV